MKNKLQRQVLLYSAILHGVLVILLIGVADRLPPPRMETPEPEESPRIVARLVRPPPAVLRELVPVTPTPAPRPTPQPRRSSDRISVGPPSNVREKELILRRDQDLRSLGPKGDRLRSEPSPPAAAPAPGASQVAIAEATPEAMPLPTPGPAFVTPGPTPPPAEPQGGSLMSSVERRVEALGKQGLPTGTGRQIGALFFDPEGADFTEWVEHLRVQVYRNWIVPQSAAFGFGTHADFEFVVERDGRVSAVRLEKSSGVPALDRAAQNALIASRPLALPADYRSPRLTLHVSFMYHVERRG